MMEQYRSIKKTLPQDTILFFRLGDFYEMFFEDAVRSSEILNITLTGRDGGPAGRVPMCGIPFHSFQPYVRTLLDRNLKVAICEQIGDPQASKGLVDRRVTRIITPATYLDEEEKPGRPEYIVAVAANSGDCALAVLDLGTGEFFVREAERKQLANELTLLQPREVVLPKGLSEEMPLAGLVQETIGAALTVYDDWVFDPQEGIRLLQENFSLGSGRGISFHDKKLAVSASGAALYHLKNHLHSALGHLRPPTLLKSQEFMILDRQAVRSLELVPGPGAEKKPATLLNVLDQTLTPMGARTLYRWILHPLLDLAKISERQDGVAEMAQNADLLEKVRGRCKGVRDVERILSRLHIGVCNARDLLALGWFLERVPEIQSALHNSRKPALQEIRAVLRPFPQLQELIARAIVETPPLTLREGGMIRDGFSAELDELRALSSKGKSWLAEFEKREIERTGIKSLRIRYNQVFGYSIEVSKPNLHLVPPEYVRKQTLANAERFIVPEIQQWDDRIAGAEEKIKELESRLFQEVRAKVLEELSSLQAAARAVGVLDALASLAFTAIRNRWIRPELSESLELTIRGGRHPVVEAMIPAGQFVENDALLDGETCQLIVLTGPNMAGKSTAIRQTALIVLLAQIGSFVPAKSARIGLVDHIFTRIGAWDDLAAGESTFMVEMIEMAHILQSATRRSLLILDEVGRGTSTFDGVSLAWAICEHLAQGKVRPRTLFATHYHELVQLEAQFPGIKNYTVMVKETPNGIVFLRKVIAGGSDRSYGIHVAQLAGIPKEVTERATQILQVLEAENAQATKIIEGQPPLALSSSEGEVVRGSTSSPRTTHSILEEIRSMKPNETSPLDALNKLAQWHRRLKGDC